MSAQNAPGGGCVPRTSGRGALANRRHGADVYSTPLQSGQTAAARRPSTAPGADRYMGRHAHMGMSVTISAATDHDVEQILKLQYLCYQREAEIYGDYTLEPLTQTLDGLRAELSQGLVLVARL